MGRRFLSIFCPAITANQLTELVEWCDRYSPLAAVDGTDGVIIDITGCAQLFGGEGPLLLNIHRHLYRMGVESREAIADGRGSAWALARYGNRHIVQGENVIPAVACLPVEALRLPDEMIAELKRLGLSTIASVRKISRNSLAARFGSTLLWRLDQVFQQAEEPFSPWRPPARYRASRVAAEPIGTTGAVEYVLHELLQEICARLEKDCLGSRHIHFTCYRVDGTLDRCELRTSKPTRSVSYLLRFFSSKLESLRAGFGFEIFVLSVLDVEALNARQLNLSAVSPVAEEASFDALVDRFSMKLGFQEVNRVHVRESFLPELATELRPAMLPAVQNAEWPAYRVRPVHLIDPPMRIEVSVLIPGASPVQFLVNGRQHRIVRSEGPERLTSEWWRDRPSVGYPRDYYRIEDSSGFRFWIFRDSSEHWFLHGHLP